MNKGHQENNSHINVPQLQGGNSINWGFKKESDNPGEPLKCWRCVEPNLLRNCLYRNAGNKTIQNIQEASIVGYVGKIIHRINTSLDGRQTHN